MEQPKKAASGYFLFLADRRESIEKDLGSKKGPDIARRAGELWKAVSEDVRKPFEEKAARLKAEYEAAMQEFKADGGVVVRKSKKDKGDAKPKKDPDAPKRPAGGGYGVYLNEHREEIKKTLPADHKITDVAKAAGAKWKSLSETEKKKYEYKYNERKQAYDILLQEYKATHPAPALEEQAKSPLAKAFKRQMGEDSQKKEPRPKKGRTSKGKSKNNNIEIDESVLAEARKAQLEGALKNLANRPEIVALDLKADKMLSILKAHNGLVNSAKHALLGC